MKCLNCDKEFIPLRSTGVYCSPECKNAFNYKKVSVENLSVDKVSVELNAKEVSVESPVQDVIGKDECDYETKVKYGRKYWENPAYLKTASDSMLQTILDVCYKGSEWIGTKAAQEVKARIPYNTPLKTAHLP